MCSNRSGTPADLHEENHSIQLRSAGARGPEWLLHLRLLTLGLWVAGEMKRNVSTESDGREVRNPFLTRGRRIATSEVWRFLASLLVVAFVLNWFWEMLQMGAYAEMAGRRWAETARSCTVATSADVGITSAIYVIGALAAGDIRWWLTGRWNVYAVCALLGFLAAWFIECQAVAAGRWSYTANMPKLPLIRTGAWPLLQLTLLVPVSVWLAGRISRPKR